MQEKLRSAKEDAEAMEQGLKARHKQANAEVSKIKMLKENASLRQELQAWLKREYMRWFIRL